MICDNGIKTPCEWEEEWLDFIDFSIKRGLPLRDTGINSYEGWKGYFVYSLEGYLGSKIEFCDLGGFFQQWAIWKGFKTH